MATPIEFTPMYIRQTIADPNGFIVRSDRWNALWNLNIQQGDNNAQGIDNLTKGLNALRGGYDAMVADTYNKVTVDNLLAVKENKAVTALHFKDVTFNKDTGVFTFTKEDGSFVTINTALERVAIDVRLDPVTSELVLTLADDTEQRVSLAAFIDTYTFLDSATISWSNAGDAYTPQLVPGSIKMEHLGIPLQDTLTGYVNAAAASAATAEQHKTAAANSASQSASSAADAQASKAAAALSASNAKGSETAAAGSKADAANAASSAAQSATASEASAVRSEAAAKKAVSIAGGDFATNTKVDAIKDQKADAYAVEVSGNPVSYRSALRNAIVKAVLNGASRQAGSGDPSPTNIRPISGISASISANGTAYAPSVPIKLYGQNEVYDTWEPCVMVDGVLRSRHTQRWLGLVLDGTETWSSGVTHKELSVTLESAAIYPPAAQKQICSHAKCIWNVTGTGFYISNSALVFGGTYNGGYLSAADFKSFLSTQKSAGTPVTIVYQLATPIVTIGDPHTITNAAGVVTISAENTLTVAFDGAASDNALRQHTGNTSNPHAVTKAQVGLDKVDNTSDANKPVSAAQQAAIQDAASSAFINAVNAIPNPNLLDNSLFTAARVNQRGVSGTISTLGYFLDRWKLISGSVTLTDDGITLNGSMAQILEYAAGTNVTASLGRVSGTATATYDNATKTLSITSAGGKIKWAKLEAGGTATTYVPKGYGVELAECQRYGRVAFISIGAARSINTMLNYDMRIVPTFAVLNQIAGTFYPVFSNVTKQFCEVSIPNPTTNYWTGTYLLSADL